MHRATCIGKTILSRGTKRLFLAFSASTRAFCGITRHPATCADTTEFVEGTKGLYLTFSTLGVEKQGPTESLEHSPGSKEFGLVVLRPKLEVLNVCWANNWLGPKPNLHLPSSTEAHDLLTSLLFPFSFDFEFELKLNGNHFLFSAGIFSPKLVSTLMHCSLLSPPPTTIVPGLPTKISPTLAPVSFGFIASNPLGNVSYCNFLFTRVHESVSLLYKYWNRALYSFG